METGVDTHNDRMSDHRTVFVDVSTDDGVREMIQLCIKSYIRNRAALAGISAREWIRKHNVCIMVSSDDGHELQYRMWDDDHWTPAPPDGEDGEQ